MSRRMIVVAALACCVGGFAEGAAPPPPSSNRASQMQPPGVPATSPAVKPDLIVEKIWVTGTQPNPGGGTRVNVRYTIANATPIDSWRFPTPAGALFWQNTPSLYQQMYSCVDVRILPTGAFPPPKAECPIMLGANAHWECYGSVVVPTGKQAEIRATVDSLNYIDEGVHENNNSKSFIWPPITAKPIPH